MSNIQIGILILILVVATVAMVYTMTILPRQFARRHIRDIGHLEEGETGWHRWFAWRPVVAGAPDEAWYGIVWLRPVERNVRYYWAIDHVWCRQVTYRRYVKTVAETNA
jgi:hypothetical protein